MSFTRQLLILVPKANRLFQKTTWLKATESDGEVILQEKCSMIEDNFLRNSLQK